MVLTDIKKALEDKTHEFASNRESRIIPVPLYNGTLNFSY
jgi:hypothetical protein